MITCSNCGERYPEWQSSCPNCGKPKDARVKKEPGRKSLVPIIAGSLIVFIIIVAVVVILLSSGSPTPPPSPPPTTKPTVAPQQVSAPPPSPPPALTANKGPGNKITVQVMAGLTLSEVSKFTVKLNDNMIPVTLNPSAGSSASISSSGGSDHLIVVATYDNGAEQVVLDKFL